jgi:membrane-associated phospholipid phosphatase
MNFTVLGTLVGGCIVLMWLERRGLRTTLALNFKGDVKRESRWFAQYGQAACTAIAVLLIWQLDPPRRGAAIAVAIAGGATSLLSMIIKRLLGRVRPGRPNAGRFLGPTLEHANFRESFPSSHSANAVALTVLLSQLYPQGTLTFWLMALLCAGLRYLLDAHWPSDVLGGIALGYALGHEAILLFKVH